MNQTRWGGGSQFWGLRVVESEAMWGGRLWSVQRNTKSELHGKTENEFDMFVNVRWMD